MTLLKKMHGMLTSDSARIGFSGQLVKGEGHYANLFDRVPVEIHAMNASGVQQHKLKLKSVLLNDDSKLFYINDVFTLDMIYNNSNRSKSKINSRVLHYIRFKVVEKNLKMLCATLSLVLDGKS